MLTWLATQWNSIASLLGIKHIDVVQNGLLLVKPLEEASDDSRICFSYHVLTKSFWFHLLDKTYLWFLSSSNALPKSGKIVLVAMTFSDLNCQLMIFSMVITPINGHSNFKHCKQSPCHRAPLFANRFWPMALRLDYKSESQCKKLVNSWFITPNFTKNLPKDGSIATSSSAEESNGLLENKVWLSLLFQIIEL